MRNSTLAAAVAIAILGLLSCERSPTAPRLDQLSLEVVSGNGQTGAVGSDLAPLIVKVTSGGNPVPLQVLNFRVVSGGGSVYGGTELTDDHGIAQEIWTLGTDASATQKVEVRAVEPSSGAERVFGVFTATALPGPAVKLGFVVQPAAVEGAQPITPAVQLAIQDAFGNTVPTASAGVTVALGTNPSGGTLSGTTTVTSSGGIATFTTLSVDRPGTGYTLAATAAGLTGATSAPIHVGLTFAAVSAGYTHTCGLTTSGAAYCWGANGSGQLGDGSTTTRLSPVLVVGGLRFAAVSAGALYTCGLTTGGAAYCWGDNSQNGGGELGDGTFTDRTSPVTVLGGLRFATVRAGNGHTCGVTIGGAAYCWGENLFGELGDGTITADSKPSPVAVTGGLAFATVSAGGPQSCGVTTAYVAYCWGDNSFGELGDGTTTSSTTPVAVGRPTLGSGTWTTKASMQTPHVGAAGGIVNGQFLIAGDASFSVAGTDVESYDPATNTWTQRASFPNPYPAYALGAGIAGNFYVVGGCLSQPTTGPDCRIGTTGNLTIYNSATNAWSAAPPMPTPRFAMAGGVINGKLYVAGGTGPCPPCASYDVVEVYDPVTNTWATKTSMPTPRAGAAAATVNGKLYVVGGANGSAFIGAVYVYDPTTDTWASKAAMPTPRVALGAGSADEVVYAISGVDASGTSVNTVEAYDPVADAWATVSPIPTARYGPAVGAITGVLYVAGSGAGNTPVTTLEAFTPATATSFAAVSAAGGHYSCGISTDAVGYCWGRNTFGQLGDGTTSNRFNPTAVVGGLTLATISAGGRFGGGFGHSCGVTTVGGTYCWGQNASGQLGDATTSDRASPVSVFGGLTFAAISASVFHTCGVTTAGAVYCWGQNDSGRLGDGTTNSSSVPLRVVQ